MVDSPEEIFAEWFERQGLKVARTPSSYWVESGPRVWQAFPYHWTIAPTESETEKFLRERAGIALRFSALANADLGTTSYHAVFDRKDYSNLSLNKTARKNVRRGLRNTTVQQVELELLGKEGWELQVDTLRRQGRRNGLDQARWKLICQSSAGLPGFLGWGAFARGRLAASLITYQMGGWVYMLYQASLQEFLPDRVNHALTFVVSQQVLQWPGIKGIFYGLHSLDAPRSVDEFKFRMGYYPKVIHQCVEFHPALRKLINPASYHFVDALHRLVPSDYRLSKAEGLMRVVVQD